MFQRVYQQQPQLSKWQYGMEGYFVLVNRQYVSWKHEIVDSRKSWNSHVVSSFITKFSIVFSNEDFSFSKRRVCPLHGLLEILASDVVVWTTPVATVDGPICSFCDLHASRIYRSATKSCQSCDRTFITTQFPPNPRKMSARTRRWSSCAPGYRAGMNWPRDISTK
jgi:hypothetical protein